MKYPNRLLYSECLSNLNNEHVFCFLQEHRSLCDENICNKDRRMTLKLAKKSSLIFLLIPKYTVDIVRFQFLANDLLYCLFNRYYAMIAMQSSVEPFLLQFKIWLVFVVINHFLQFFIGRWEYSIGYNQVWFFFLACNSTHMTFSIRPYNLC